MHFYLIVQHSPMVVDGSPEEHVTGGAWKIETDDVPVDG
jgi:hypothetical protein